MRALLVPLLACAALGGCAAYGDPYGYGYGAAPAYGYGAAPAYGYPAGGVYYGAPATVEIGVYGTSGYRGGRGLRDRDHDGIPNRYDRDRDGDGVRNRDDARPNNPRRQ